MHRFPRLPGLLPLVLALLAALATSSRPALASSPLLAASPEVMSELTMRPLEPGAVGRSVTIPLLRLSRRQPAPVAAPSAPAATTWTSLPGWSPAGSAALPPVRPSVRLLTGRLNE